METTRRRVPSRVIAAGAALGMAAVAALALIAADAIWFGTSSSGGADVTLLYIVGWVLLVWSAIVGGAVLVHLIRTAAVDKRVALPDTLLVAGTIVVITLTVLTHPLIGSGGSAV